MSTPVTPVATPSLTRRRALRSFVAAAALPTVPAIVIASPPTRREPLDDDLVHRFVSAAHADLDAVRALLDEEPRLVRASSDRGGGDFESGLGAAGHTGRREIVTLLLERGAPFELCPFAMLGRLDIVRPVLCAQPALIDVPGPHGISLITHARNGGAEAEETYAWLDAFARGHSAPDTESKSERRTE